MDSHVSMENLKSERSKAIVASVFLFYLGALPMMFVKYGNLKNYAYLDQITFHFPTIQQLAKKLDFFTYPSATTPGYHLLLSLFSSSSEHNELYLKLISSLFSAATIALLASLLVKNLGKMKTIIFLLPLSYSLNFFRGGVWLTPDSLSWLCMTALILVLLKGEMTRSRPFICGLILLIAVFVRQTNLHLVATVGLISLFDLFNQRGDARGRYKPFISAVLSILPTLILFLVYFMNWKGLVPPAFQSFHQNHFSFSVPAYFLSLVFFYSMFYMPVYWRAIWKIVTTYRSVVILGAVIGLVAAVLPETNYDRDLGRFGGFWEYVKFVPAVQKRSLLVLLFATLGGGAFAVHLMMLTLRQRIILLTATTGYVLSMIANGFVWERYFSYLVFLNIFLPLAFTKKIEWKETSVRMLIFPILFTAINVVILYKLL